jgi:hypothetical protein
MQKEMILVLIHTSISPNTLLTEPALNEQLLLIQCRDVYGQGTVATLASLEADGRAALLEQRSRDGSTIIAVTSAEAAQKLSRFFARVATFLP